jgi:O-acetyl-ADP-ribose deacetylase (regulator of RNase III)
MTLRYIKYGSEDMFDRCADIRVNTVNCVGVMGTGVAKRFKHEFPAMFRAYKQRCDKGLVHIGAMDIHQAVEIRTCGEGLSTSMVVRRVTIINFPTKTHWRKPSDIQYIDWGLANLKRYLETIDSVDKDMTLPALGCGNGGLKWGPVKGAIEHFLANVPTNIYVYEPSEVS